MAALAGTGRNVCKVQRTVPRDKGVLSPRWALRSPSPRSLFLAGWPLASASPACTGLLSGTLCSCQEWKPAPEHSPAGQILAFWFKVLVMIQTHLYPKQIANVSSMGKKIHYKM